MIVRKPHLELAEFGHVHYVDTRIVAVALCNTDGVRVATAEPARLLAIRAVLVIEPEIDLRAVFGGPPFESLDAATALSATKTLVECLRKAVKKS